MTPAAEAITAVKDGIEKHVRVIGEKACELSKLWDCKYFLTAVGQSGGRWVI
jgi:hypothetical protein